MGSITLPTGWQKFETCPDWGAKSHRIHSNWGLSPPNSANSFVFRFESALAFEKKHRVPAFLQISVHLASPMIKLISPSRGKPTSGLAHIPRGRWRAALLVAGAIV